MTVLIKQMYKSSFNLDLVQKKIQNVLFSFSFILL